MHNMSALEILKYSGVDVEGQAKPGFDIKAHKLDLNIKTCEEKLLNFAFFAIQRSVELRRRTAVGCS